MDFSTEEWRIVPSVPEVMVSTHGRVQLVPTIGVMPNGGPRHYSTRPQFGPIEKSASGRSDSSRRRIIRVDKLKRTFKVYRLVCEAFHGDPPTEDHIVLHLDEDPSNNRPENLRWGTRKENQNFPKAVAAFKARTGSNSSWAIHYRNSGT
jgi:HNH endonuclease.